MIRFTAKSLDANDTEPIEFDFDEIGNMYPDDDVVYIRAALAPVPVFISSVKVIGIGNDYTKLIAAMTVSELQYEIERIESFLPGSAGGSFTDKWTARLAEAKALMATYDELLGKVAADQAA